LTDWKAKHAAGNINQGGAENLPFKQPKSKLNRFIRPKLLRWWWWGWWWWWL